MGICRIVSKFAPKIERNQMNKFMKTICGLFTAMLLLTSCMKSDNSTTTLYTDTAITGFSLGTLNRYLHTTSSTGGDSIYKVTITGSDYKFSIDQANHRIFNADSLPVNTDVKKVVCNVTTLNNGSVFIEDTEDSDALSFYSSTDSVDFSTPRKFLVYSSDGSTHEEYTVQLNVHKEAGEQFNWILHQESAEIAEMDRVKAVMCDENLYVFGSKEGKTIGYTTVDGESWKPVTEIDDENAYKNMLVLDKGLYTIANGKLQQSNDGTEWTVVNDALDVTQLVAANFFDLYGLTSDGTLLKSEDKGVSWTEEILDTDKSWLPTMDIAYVCYPANMTYYADYMLMAGVSNGVDKISSVWRKIVEYDLQGDERWVYMDRMDNDYALPQLENLIMMYYDDGILAFGIKDDAYSPIYQSRDNGIVWKENSRYQLPVEFKNSAVTCLGAATDGKEIWLVGCNGQVWQGHLNKVAWEKSE